jgi:pyruvate dehydrogenase E2 component (dihydrolipoamide acetyltransferase)
MTTPSPRGLAVKQVIALNRVRKMMAKTMHESVQRAALSQVSREIDLTALQAARQRDGEQRHSINSYILAAVARALTNHPLLNAELVEDKVLVYDVVNLGVAIDTAAGLIVAVIPEAEKKALDELSAAVAELATRARNNKLTLADIEGGTFTVSNLGMYGIDGGFPLPRPPEGAILLVGRMRHRPDLVDGALINRPYAWFTLTFDHRFIDGASAARFLQDLQELLSGY